MVTCTRASLGVTAAPDITIVVKVDPAQTANLSNSATVASATSDPDNTNNTGTAATTVNTSADLSLVKTDSPDPVTAGNNLSYTLSVSNAGPSNAASLSVTDSLPAGTSLVSATGTGWSCSGTTMVTCTRASLAVTSAPDITVVVKVDPAQTANLSNSATVTSATSDPDNTNNTGTAASTVNTSADLSLVKADSPDPVTAGNNLTYTLSVSNAGPSNAASLSVTDSLPAGTSLVSATGTGWSCSGTTMVTCTRASLAVTSAPDITVVVKVDPAQTANLSNSATVTSATSDPDNTNNTGTAASTVNTSADLSLVKADSPDPVTAGNNLTYTLSV